MTGAAGSGVELWNAVPEAIEGYVTGGVFVDRR